MLPRENSIPAMNTLRIQKGGACCPERAETSARDLQMTEPNSALRSTRSTFGGLKSLSLFAFLVSLIAPSFVRAEVKAGDAFPPLASAGLKGAVPATTGQVVLVDFWASWCQPCKASFPIYAKLHADYASKGLVILAVSIDENASDYKRFVKKLAPPFVTVLDQGQKLVGQVQVPTMPTSYLIGRDGKVRFVHAGFHDNTERELREQIALLLAEK